MDLDSLIEGISKTGFKLEFAVSNILISHGWNVINNKYYVDDLSGSVREIDLVAYKATKVQHFYVYTVLIISCKKSEKDAWALLSKTRNKSDPNLDWNPLHIWSSDKVIDYLMNLGGWKADYISDNEKHGSELFSETVDHQIFAFQEMDRTNGRPKNDKNIFNSITSLMKAQSYEMNALRSRKKEPVVYQFNLISIMDTELVRVDLSHDKTEAVIVQDELYVADYIIDKRQTSAKIHFIKFDAFNSKLAKYGKLHKANALILGEKYTSFYSKIPDDHKATNLLVDELAKKMIWPIQRCFFRAKSKLIDLAIKDFTLSWSKANEILHLGVDLNTDDIDYLNNDTEARKDLKEHLATILRYQGNSEFEMLIPF